MDQALNAAANAINALLTAITNERPEKNILLVNFFNIDKTQDPLK
ncbi:11367_t:CDS:1, partial [Gigaspora margarita]